MTRSRPAIWGSIALLVVITILATFANIGWDKAFGAEPSLRPDALVTGAVPEPARSPSVKAAGEGATNRARPLPPIQCSVPYSDFHCQKTTFMHNKVKAFRSGSMGNARGFEFLPRIKTMIRNQIAVRATSPNFRDDSGPWWKAPFQGMRCMAYGFNLGSLRTSSCRDSSENYTQMQRETTRITVVCGGSAVLGTLRGGGYWGAGIGLVGCFFGEIFSAVYNAQFRTAPSVDRADVRLRRLG